MNTPLRGKLYLVPAPLDFGCDEQAPLQDALPLGTLQAAARITHWICENAKSARAYLKRNSFAAYCDDTTSSECRVYPSTVFVVLRI